MNLVTTLLDRTAVLLIGVGVGVAIGLAFAPDGDVTALSSPPASAAAGAVRIPANTPAFTPKVKSCPKSLMITPRLASAMVSSDTVQVGVFGDSFGDGIWAGLYNDLRAEKMFAVHQFSAKATGFTRYRQLNLQDKLEEQLADQPIDLGVISFGANDTQDIWEEGRLMPYMSEDWKRVVAKRARAYVERIRRDGAAVVWIGLPRMRTPRFDGQIAQMNAFYAGLMCDLNVPFIDTLPKSVDRNGGYTDYLRPLGGGEPIKARAPDGIHMSMTGYRILIADMTGDIHHLAGEFRPGLAKASTRFGPARQLAR